MHEGPIKRQALIRLSCQKVRKRQQRSSHHINFSTTLQPPPLRKETGSIHDFGKQIGRVQPKIAADPRSENRSRGTQKAIPRSQEKTKLTA